MTLHTIRLNQFPHKDRCRLEQELVSRFVVEYSRKGWIVLLIDLEKLRNGPFERSGYWPSNTGPCAFSTVRALPLPLWHTVQPYSSIGWNWKGRVSLPIKGCMAKALVMSTSTPPTYAFLRDSNFSASLLCPWDFNSAMRSSSCFHT